MNLGRQRNLVLVFVIAWALSLSPRTTHAEFWVERAEELFRTATRIEIVRITSATPTNVTYTVEQSLRGGRATGTTDLLASGYFSRPLPGVGQRVLVVCESGQCPRAFGVDRGGAWVLNAQEPGDGAALIPPVLEDAAVRAMASGRPAPPLCIRLATRFARSTAPSPPIEARVDPGNGGGTATGTLLGAPRAANFGIPFASERDMDFSISIHATRGQVTFDGRVTGRAPDGCLLADASIERPVARTPAELTARLGGSTGAALLAQGTLHPIPGVARMSGPTPVSLSSQGGNELSLRMGSLVGSGVAESVALTQAQPGALLIGFHHGPSSATYPALLVEVPRPVGGGLVSASAAVIDALPPGRTVRWRIFFSANGTAQLPAGEIELTGVAP